MSRTTTATSSAAPTQTCLAEPAQVEALLHALNDPDARAILRATSDESLSAAELAEVCGVPLSSTYRKLDRLTEAGLLAERNRVRLSGVNTTEYRRRVEDVTLSLATEGIELRVTERPVVGEPESPSVELR